MSGIPSEASDASKAHKGIYVAGHAPVELFIYTQKKNPECLGVVNRRAGAMLLSKLLRCEKAQGYHGHDVCGPLETVNADNTTKPEKNPINLILGLTRRGTDKKEFSYRVDRCQRAFPEPSCNCWGPILDSKPLILALEDHSELLQNPCLELPSKIQPKFLVYSMRCLVAGQAFFNNMAQNKNTNGGDKQVKDKENQESHVNIAVIDADDLRSKGMELSRHLSWERTAEDFIRYIIYDSRFESISSEAHVVVRFSCDGAFHYSSNEKRLTLYFDGTNAEGDYISEYGPMAGISTAFMAGFVSSLAKNFQHPNWIEESISVGLHTARKLAFVGFRLEGDEPNYPLRVMEDMTPLQNMLSVPIPIEENFKSLHWSRFWMNQDPGKFLHEIVIKGRDVLSDAPTASFGKLITADRQEIEGFRSIANLVQEYLKGPPESQSKPLSIGVFGPPGSGKSFGVVQVIEQASKQVHKGKQTETLEFNLSQFADYSDLSAAFQLIRDKTLSGKIPLVMFDEFDSSLGDSRLGWLKYFLAPMQDGQFLERGHTHPLGAAIFVFLGGTAPTYEMFANGGKLTPTPTHIMEAQKDNANGVTLDAMLNTESVKKMYNDLIKNPQVLSAAATAKGLKFAVTAAGLKGLKSSSFADILSNAPKDLIEMLNKAPKTLGNIFTKLQLDDDVKNTATRLESAAALAVANAAATARLLKRASFDDTLEIAAEKLEFAVAEVQPSLFATAAAAAAARGLGLAAVDVAAATIPALPLSPISTATVKGPDFLAVKGPDFISRLRGFVNIRGPDLIDENDGMHRIRRAILLHAMLNDRLSMRTGPIEVDNAVLHGFLTVPKFHHGARSLKAILAMSRVSDQGTLERSGLPSEPQLNLHVDAKEFMALVRDYKMLV